MTEKSQRDTPRRLISHSSSMPLCAFTRARTISPSSSISAPVASPSLMRKLQCISETCAPPTLSPRQPAASINCQALLPGGFLKVEPPGLLAVGGDVVHLGEDRGGLAGCTLKQSLSENEVLGRAAVTIGVMQLGNGKRMHFALTIDSSRLGHDLTSLASMRAAIHAQRSADAARDAAIE